KGSPVIRSLRHFSPFPHRINHLNAIPPNWPIPMRYKESVEAPCPNQHPARPKPPSHPQIQQPTQEPLHLQQNPPFSTTQRTQPNPSSGILISQEGPPCAPSFFV